MRIAYLVSRHPVVSQAFLGREIDGLRRNGIEVETISIRRPRPDDLLGEDDRAQAASTFYVLPAGPLRLVRAHAGALRFAPRRYLATLRLALRQSSPGPRNHLWQLFYFAEAVVVWWRVRDRGIGHIHAVQFADAAADAAMLAAELDSELTWSVTVHGPQELLEPERFRLADKLRRADLVIAISDYARRQLRVLPGGDRPIELVPVGTDPDAFAPPGDRPPHEPVRIVSVGRLVPQKGHATLIEALAEARRRGIELWATIVGEGPERDRLESLASELGLGDFVGLVGAVAHERIRSLYAEADLFCLASLAEGVPVSVAEAMAMELAVVATAVTGTPELIDDGVDGVLVPPGDPVALADAIERLARDPDLRLRLGRAARRKVSSRFDARHSAARLSDLTRQAAGA